MQNSFNSKYKDDILGMNSTFDRVIITAAGPTVPPPLIKQLRVNGNLVMPLGRPGLWQQMTRYRKVSDTDITEEKLASVAFVPLRGMYGI